ncbi:TetR/AcrR family transcriptional regulator [Haloprofundus salilacus]|uniref:TetR/AcrR family transcriptional regulator n=1 Tax=Haloprofundus salilacus TaxID=2876190 RepID=UPI001CC8F8D0|nr:TetR/AcrR family transcriptional regulator [Haloprofundus salilacus]
MPLSNGMTEMVRGSSGGMRGFDDEERKEIREALVDAGEKFFLRVGPRKTTVKELTDEVGIAKGSFYNFFDSKSELFMEVFIRIGRDNVGAALKAVEDVEDGQEGIRLLFHAYADWLEDHPIIQKFAADVDQDRFRRSFPADQFAAAERKRDELLAAPVERWQANGTLRDDVSPVAVVELLQLVLLLAVTNDEYDEDYYRKRNFAIETLARGLEP